METKSLVSLAEESAKIEIALALSGGELTPEIEAMLADINVAVPAKVENYALLMERMDALAQHYASRAEMLVRMAKAAKNVIARCEDNLQLAMIRMDQSEISGIDIRFKLQNSPPKVVIDDESAIDPAYTVQEITTKIEKKRIGEDLKNGVPVRGARLEFNKHVRKYANTPGGR